MQIIGETRNLIRGKSVYISTIHDIMKFTAQPSINWSRFEYSEPLTKQAVLEYYCFIFPDLTPELKCRFINRMMKIDNDKFIADFNKTMSIKLTAFGPYKFRFRYEK